MPQSELYELRAELKQLTIQVTSLMERYERTLESLAQNTLQLGSNVQRSTQNLQHFQSSLPHSIKDAAYQAIKEGMNQSVRESKGDLSHVVSHLKFEAYALKDDRDKAQKMAKWLSYKTLSLVYGSALLVLVVSSFYGWKNIQTTRQEVKRAEWISNINGALSTGKLTACPDGGICANINQKLIRLDK